MLEKLKKQANEIEIILEKIKKLDETVEPLLIENKYAKEITQKYFKEEKNIIKTIKDNKKLISELKNNYIKLTDEQKQKEQKFKEYIEELTNRLESILKIIKKIETEKVYIDNEIIEILDLNEIEDLKRIIEFNKIVNQKKLGIIKAEKNSTQKLEQTRKIDKPKEEEKDKTIKEEPVKMQEPTKKEEKINELKPEEEKKVEKLLIYKNKDEIDEYLKRTYNIEIETQKSIEELNDMIETLENEPFQIKDANLIKKILEISDLERLINFKDYFKIRPEEAEKYKYIEDIYDIDEIITQSTSIIINSNLEYKKKIELLNKTHERKRIMVKNRVITLLYGMNDTPEDLLLKKIDEDKIDQILELGHIITMLKIVKCSNTNALSGKQLQDILDEFVFKNIKKYLYEKMILSKTNPSNESIKTARICKEVISEATKTGDIKNAINKLQKMLKETPKENMTVASLVSNQKVKISTNPILKVEEETNKKSKENFLKSYLSSSYSESPINKINNKYLDSLKKYTNDKLPTYSIPVKENYCKNGTIEISKIKVVRLINQHILEGHEITKEIIKQCMFYNLMITDELLNEVDKILTTQFDMLDQKIKKY